MAKIICLTGSIVGYAYLMELFMAWYSANTFEKFTFFHARFNLGRQRLLSMGLLVHDVLQRHFAAGLLVQDGAATISGLSSSSACSSTPACGSSVS